MPSEDIERASENFSEATTTVTPYERPKVVKLGRVDELTFGAAGATLDATVVGSQ